MRKSSVYIIVFRIVLVVILSAMMILQPSTRIYASNNASNTISSQGKKSTLPRLKVKGTSLYDSNNKKVVLKGFCCGTSTRIEKNWSTWYTDKTFKTIKSWGVNVFRITLKPDQYVAHPEYMEMLYRYIDMCVDNKLYVLITWMGNEDYLKYTEQAKTFFDSMSKRYKNCNNIIYEVCNEPFYSPWSAIHDYAEVIIPVIRANSPNSVIAVPVAYHIKNTDETMDKVIDYPLEYKNIIYTFHLYVGNSLKKDSLDSIDNLLAHNLPVFISEWGATSSKSQDSFYKEKSIIWLNFLDSRNISWINFNLSDVYWNNKPYASSAVKMGQWNSDLNDEILSESGYFMKHYFLGDLD